VREALRIGSGFVVKIDAGKELLPAIKSVILDRQFLSGSLEGHSFREVADAGISAGLQ
jgi:hypothetical protein